jgi:tetratricopeptide (TPR) repeat protein
MVDSLDTRAEHSELAEWAEAGRHALVEGSYERAQEFFERCLQADGQWLPGLTGMAIVLERRKLWRAALIYRERTVHVARALERDDPESLQHVMRYAAALGRVERWAEAGVLFRRCVARGVFERVPAERPELLRVFANELYAPAMIAAWAPEQPAAAAAAEIEIARREARVFEAASAWVRDADGLESAQRQMLLGMCAWLAGDYERAYALFGEAEVESPGDQAIQLLLAWSAREVGSSDDENIARVAQSSAVEVLEAIERGEPVDEEAEFYARVTRERFESPAARRTREARARDRESSDQVALKSAGAVTEADSVSRSECEVESFGDAAIEVPAQLRALVAQRVFLRTRGASPLEAARESSRGLAQLERVLEVARSERRDSVGELTGSPSSLDRQSSPP